MWFGYQSNCILTKELFANVPSISNMCSILLVLKNKNLDLNGCSTLSWQSSAVLSFVSCLSNLHSILSSIEARALSYPVANLCHKESKLHVEFLWCPSSSLKLMCATRSRHISWECGHHVLKFTSFCLRLMVSLGISIEQFTLFLVHYFLDDLSFFFGYLICPVIFRFLS